MKPELFGRVDQSRDVEELGLKKGDVATAVDFAPHPLGGEEGCLLEIFNAVGDSIQVVAVPVSAVSPLTANDIPSIRPRTAV
ncbi:MAG TPA: DUF4926 domain-containing protein [Candidatus Hydrogenedentes bacterium]|nr:DUF4926 domain-containing protein [Candidatus Hydrogenedentota bacterium]HRK35730.1 DUF4926 domain-containing protein [Candidatus Hydrogenedentota bacterium]